MELTRFTDYSLRVLISLAQEPGKRKAIDELADFYSIPRNHLTKITKHLAEHGWIETARGKNGGIWLSKDPTTINLAEVIKTTEPHFDLVECFRPDRSNCVIDGCCTLKGILFSARAQFFAHLAKYSLADASRCFSLKKESISS